MVNKEQNPILIKKMAEALLQLSPHQKEIIYLKFYLNLTYEEVSDIMQINYQASHNLIY